MRKLTNRISDKQTDKQTDRNNEPETEKERKYEQTRNGSMTRTNPAKKVSRTIWRI